MIIDTKTSKIATNFLRIYNINIDKCYKVLYNEEKKKKLGGKRSMARKILGNQDNKFSEETQAFLDYVKTKGAQRDNVTSVEAQPIIPEDIKYQPEELPETFVDLKKFVNVQPVTTQSG